MTAAPMHPISGSVAGSGRSRSCAARSGERFCRQQLDSAALLDGLSDDREKPAADSPAPNLEAKYRACWSRFRRLSSWLISTAESARPMSSPQIEAALGYSREEWLEDPVRWYQHIHPDDKQRWSLEAAEMFLSGKPLRSAYRVIARDGRVVWFHCDARMVRREDGRPWFIHGVAFDISDLKQVEEAAAGRAQCGLGDPRYRWRAGCRSRSRRTDSCVSTRRAN